MPGSNPDASRFRACHLATPQRPPKFAGRKQLEQRIPPQPARRDSTIGFDIVGVVFQEVRELPERRGLLGGNQPADLDASLSRKLALTTAPQAWLIHVD